MDHSRFLNLPLTQQHFSLQEKSKLAKTHCQQWFQPFKGACNRWLKIREALIK
jgi:hypothetical protein